MKQTLKKIALTTLASSVLLSGFAAAGSNSAEAARKGFDKKKVGGKVTFSTFGDAIRLTPNTIADAVSNRIIGMVFDALLTTNAGGQPIPSVGTKWTISADKKTYVVNMRKDVKFHDGQKLTAHDVAFSYEMYTHKDSINPYRTSTYGTLESVKALNDYQVEFKFKEADAFALYVLMAPIMPKHVYKDINTFNNDTKLQRKPVGSGPFVFSQWKTAERIVVKANTKYWNGRPYMDQVIMKVLPDQNVETLNLLKGTTNFVEAVQPKSISQVSKNKNLKVMKYDQASYIYIGWNVQDPRFKEKEVRQALATALNRQAIVDKILLKNGTLASGPIHPKLPMYNKSVKPLPYSTSKAADMLEDAGWKLVNGVRQKNGVKLELELGYNTGNKVREAIATMAQQDWGKIGVKVQPRSVEWSRYLENIQKGEQDAWVLGWNLGTSGDQYGLFHSTNIPKWPNQSNNTSRVDDSRVDKILEDFRAEYNPAERNKLYNEYHKIMNDNQYNLFLYYPKGTAGMHKQLGGVKFSLWSRFYNVDDWYWTSSKMRKKK